jgi:hypothetical protein
MVRIRLPPAASLLRTDFPVGSKGRSAQSHPATAPAGSNRSSHATRQRRPCLLRWTLRGDATCEVVNARLTLLWISVFVLLSDGSIPTRHRSAMRDRDFAEMATAFEMAVGAV